MVILSYKITKLKEQNVKEFCYLKLSNKKKSNTREIANIYEHFHINGGRKWYEKYLLKLRNDINIKVVHQRALLGQGSSIQRSITR